MIDFFTRMVRNINSVITSVQDSFSQTLSAIKYISSNIPYRILLDAGKQIKAGFLRITDPTSLAPIQESRRTQFMLKQSVINNLMVYLAFALFYESIKPLIKDGLSYVDMDDTGVETTLFVMMSCHVKYIIKLHNFVDKTADRISQAKILAEENPNNQNYSPCPHAESKALMMRADIESIFYNLANVFFAYVTKCTLRESLPSPVGNILSFPIRALAYGQLILEPKICAAGVCTEDRYIILSRNFLYVAGMGSSYLTAVNLFTKSVGLLTGVDEDLIESPISHFVFPFYLISAMTLVEALPGCGSGLDVFYHCRVLTESLIGSVISISSKLLLQCQPGYFLKLVEHRPSSKSIRSNQLYIYPLTDGSLEYAGKIKRQIQRFRFNENDLGECADKIKKKFSSRNTLGNEYELDEKTIARIYQITSTHGLTYPNNPLTIVNRILNYPPLRLLKLICLDENLRTIRGAVTRPSISRCMELYETEINELLSWLKFVIAIRSFPFVKPVSKFTHDYLPSFLLPHHGKLVLQGLFDQRVPEVVDYINDLIFNSRLSLSPIQINVIFHASKPLTKNFVETYVEPVQEIQWINDTWDEIDKEIEREEIKINPDRIKKAVDFSCEENIPNIQENSISLDTTISVNEKEKKPTSQQSLSFRTNREKSNYDKPFIFFMIPSDQPEPLTSEHHASSAKKRSSTLLSFK